MANSKPILIACPQYRTLVGGTYQCDEAGRYRFGPDGTFDLKLAECGQHGGRCMETLCALHRYNRGGPETWYPGRVLAAPDRSRTPRARQPTGHAGNGAPALY